MSTFVGAIGVRADGSAVMHRVHCISWLACTEATCWSLTMQLTVIAFCTTTCLKMLLIVVWTTKA